METGGLSRLALLLAVCLIALAVAVSGCAGQQATERTAGTKAATVSRPTQTSAASRPAPLKSGGPLRSSTSAVTSLGEAPRPAPEQPSFLVVVLENKEYSQVIGNPEAPQLNYLARKYVLATQSYARTHPSLPNYLDLVSGTTFGITTDCYSCQASGTNIGLQAQEAGLAWGAYFGGVPHSCFGGYYTDAGYAKKHDPFAYFPQLMADPGSCSHLKPISDLAPDLNGVPTLRFGLIVPDLCHDGHDCPISVMDAYVGYLFQEVKSSRWWSPGHYLVITFDEGSTSATCCGLAHGGHVATVIASPSLAGGGSWDQPLTTAGILRTIELALGLPLLGEASKPAAGDFLALIASH